MQIRNKITVKLRGFVKTFNSYLLTVIATLFILFTPTTANAHDSYLQFVRQMGKSMNQSFCLESGNIVFAGPMVMDARCIPSALSDPPVLNSGCPTNAFDGAAIESAVNNYITSLPTLLIKSVSVIFQILATIDFCTNAFVMPYNEEVMFNGTDIGYGTTTARNYMVQGGGNNAVFYGDPSATTLINHINVVVSDVITQTDIPSRFQCTDRTLRGYNPIACNHYPAAAISGINSGNVTSSLDVVSFYYRFGANLLGTSAYTTGSSVINPITSATTTITTSPSIVFTTRQLKIADTYDSWGAASLSYVPWGMAQLPTPFLYRMKAYYSFSAGRMNLCVGSPDTFLPIQIGCIGMAPPQNGPAFDPRVLNYFKNTRCVYLFSPRMDLQSLGNAIPQSSIAKFLQSDFHPLSTTIGCIKDVLAQEIVPNQLNPNFSSTFFNRVQTALKGTAYAALTLYIVLVGMKIISATQVPEKAEFFVYLMKFLFVVYFLTGEAWYGTQNTDGTTFVYNSNAGLYGMIMNTAEEIADIFLTALAQNDPMGRCTLNQSAIPSLTAPINLLGQVDFPATSPSIPISDYLNGVAGGSTVNVSNCTTPNIGTQPALASFAPVYALTYFSNNGLPQSGFLYQTTGAVDGASNCVIRLSVWDMVDCKIANYLNFGSCQYDLVGLVLVWCFSPAVLAALTGFKMNVFIFAICSMIYLFFLFLIVLKYAHIFILSFFVLTVMILLSPIYIVFSLFKATAEMFKSWVKTIIGYCVYPGTLFAYFALMFACLDSLFFGYVTDPSKTNQNTANPAITDPTSAAAQVAGIKAQCAQGVNLPYCFFAAAAQINDPCTSKVDTYNLYTTQYTFGFITFTVFNLPSSLSDDNLYNMLLKMLLFTGLFYMFTSSAGSTLETIAQIQGLGNSNLAMGSFNFMHVAGGASMSNIGKAGKAIANQKFGKDNKSLAQRASSAAKTSGGMIGRAARGNVGKGASAAGKKISSATKAASRGFRK